MKVKHPHLNKTVLLSFGTALCLGQGNKQGFFLVFTSLPQKKDQVQQCSLSSHGAMCGTQRFDSHWRCKCFKNEQQLSIYFCYMYKCKGLVATNISRIVGVRTFSSRTTGCTLCKSPATSGLCGRAVLTQILRMTATCDGGRTIWNLT